MIDRFLRKLSVRTRIVGGFLILIVLLTLSVPVSVANYNFLVDRLRQVTNVEAGANRALLLASTRIANSRVNLMRYIDNQVPSPTEALDDTDTAISLLTGALEQRLINAPDQQQDVTTVAQALTEYWRKPVVVDNRPGAGSAVGTSIRAPRSRTRSPKASASGWSESWMPRTGPALVADPPDSLPFVRVRD